MMVLQSLEMEIACTTTVSCNTSTRIADVNTLCSKDREIERMINGSILMRLSGHSLSL
jgi:tRNA/tmRNA/rRNA uracil-C5-methylase (TrmA/RlmC/RlmD family)